jgi:ATP-binding cassette subfamily B protein/ATP-binding cassette subfamily C protein/ATP-binding cassette subfamily B multidrug efflux pump
MQLFQQLSWFFREHWRTYSVALLLLSLVAMLNLSIPWLVGQSVDHLAAADSDGHSRILWLLLGCALAIYVLRFSWRQILFGTAYRLGNLLRSRFYQRLTRQGDAFYAEHNTGDLMARATNDIDAIEMAAGEGILSGFDGLLTFVLVMIMMVAVIDWRLTLIALLPFPIMAFGFHRLSNRIHQQFNEALEQFSALNDRTQEALSGIRMIRALGREQQEFNDYAAITTRAAKANYEVARSEALFDPLIFLCMSASLLLTLVGGSWLISTDQLSIGELTGFTLYLGQLIWPMWAFGWLLNIIERGSAAWKRVDATLKTPDSIADLGKQPVSDTHLCAQGLQFTYPNSHAPALQEISFELPAGQSLGIAGPTGAGKSTLIQLLMRYREADRPEQLKLGAHPVADYPLQALRSCFAWVPQDPFLFSLTVAENIALSQPDASPEAIRHAAWLAAVDEDIERLPKGYDTPVGERGVTLSGGQRQRIALARALLTSAPILILDDSLSAVDLDTEKRILQRLTQASAQRSLIIISHRLSALRQCDRIMVLQQGHLDEFGTHDQLVANDGWYSRMWTYQQMEEETDVRH